MKLIEHALILLASIGMTLFILITPLSSYLTQILGFLILVAIIFIVVQKRRNKGAEILSGSAIEVFTITTGILLTIFLTGGLDSQLFFLTYFLMFGIAFLMRPASVFVFVLGAAGLFAQQHFDNVTFSEIVKLASLLLLSPIAFFFGTEFERREKITEEIEDRTDKIIEDADRLRETADNTEEHDLIDEIIEESQELKEESEK